MASFYSAGCNLPYSVNGWTYCLSSPCGEYIKIGKTAKHPLSRQQDATYAKDMKLAWAIDDKCFELAFHKALKENHSAIVKVEKSTGQAEKQQKLNLSDYLTETEARDKGWVFEPEKIGLILARKITIPHDWIRARRRPNIELFHISPSKAKLKLKKEYPEAFK